MRYNDSRQLLLAPADWAQIRSALVEEEPLVCTLSGPIWLCLALSGSLWIGLVLWLDDSLFAVGPARHKEAANHAETLKKPERTQTEGENPPESATQTSLERS